MTFSNTLAIWAATLSTILGAIKIWEVWKQRLRLTTSYSFAGTDDGNEVIIENPTSTPAMISYWELLMMHRSLWRWSTVNGRFPNEGHCNITIAPHSRHILAFQEQQYFKWPIPGATALYLKLYVIGRRRVVWLLVDRGRR